MQNVKSYNSNVVNVNKIMRRVVNLNKIYANLLLIFFPSIKNNFNSTDKRSISNFQVSQTRGGREELLHPQLGYGKLHNKSWHFSCRSASHLIFGITSLYKFIHSNL